MRTKKERFAGIDVSAKKLTMAWEALTGEVRVEDVPNTAAGHQQIVRLLSAKRGAPVRTTVEATSVYMLDLAIALHAAHIPVMVVNPFQAHKFGQANNRRSKTDGVDSRMLRDYGRRMEWVAWSPPPEEVLELRYLARRREQVVKARVAEENRLHTAKSTKTTPRAVIADLEASIEASRVREAALHQAAMTLIRATPVLAEAHEIVTSMKGVGDQTAIAVLPELLVLPTDMTVKQVVAHAGLDPRHKQSGMAEARTHISKIGNARIRASLWMSAMSATAADPVARAFVDRIEASGKLRIVGTVAWMRKMLGAMWVMLKKKTKYDRNLLAPRQRAA
jgi:transposase